MTKTDTVQVFREFSRRKAKEAEQEGLEPMTATPGRIANWRRCCVERTLPVYLFPYLGPYLPEGWRRVSLKPVADTPGIWVGDEYPEGVYVVSLPEFARSLGALDPFEFANRITEGWGYAIVGESPKAVLIGAFRQTESEGR